MFRKLTGKHKTNSSLDLSRGQRSLLAVSCELSGLAGDTLENIVDEGVHNRHALLRYTGVRMDLLENSIDVRGIRFHALLGSLLAG